MMARNPAAQTAFGPMVQVAIEQYEAPERRLVSDDLALSMLPAGQRAMVRAMRWPLLRRLTTSAGERAVPGSWSLIACRKRYIDDKLDEAIENIDSVVVLGAGMDTRAYRLARRSDIPVFEVDLPVNIARKKAAVQRAIGAQPASVHLVPLDFERDDLIGALTEHGYRPDARTFFIWEGVTQYLTEDAVRATLVALKATPAGKSAGVHLHPQGLHRRGEHVRRRNPVQAFQATSAGVALRAGPGPGFRVHRRIRLAT
jgi:methyltransferase (TIGR00027 family)